MKGLPFAAALLLLAAQEEKVDFARDVQPILKASCLKCHGPEKPKGQFRLDVRSLALKGGVAGKAILPGQGAESPLVKLLLETDSEARMPQKAPPLTKAQIDLLRRWIDQGAEWPAGGEAVIEKHWAYVKPARPAVPALKGARSPIDAFIQARLEKEGLTPSPEAPREKLLRRVSLDLIGLPPSPAEIDAFVADTSPEAYEKVVDRLLASPHYGERWARPWLDLARYADTNGFNFDSPRTMWKYRDWVIKALNDDKPFTEFTIEQLAGDLLPGATLDQKVATGFHRNTLTNEEGGTDKEEARWETLIDRTNTTAFVWLGSTLACAQCHNHKYDPFTQKEYYKLLAFFDSSDEPRIDLLTPEQEAERKAVRERIAAEEKTLLKVAEAELPVGVTKALGVPYANRTNTQRNDVVIFCRSQMTGSRELGDRLLELYRVHGGLESATALVLQERATPEPPSTHLRIKGGFTNVGEKVVAGVPASLPSLPEGVRPDRLALARWLVSEENPLTARVVVNRFWDLFFGRPLVETPEDLGTQSQRPVHPELLDWLAVEFMGRGWSMKAIQRTIVLSSTYRQSSRLTPLLQEKDPFNRFLARGPRFRMEAEMIRDVTLSASGLLSRKIGGPSVFPLQADTSGVVAINKVDTRWTPSEGEDRHRRGLYTHWRRTAPFVAFGLFDAPTRESCTVRRLRSNTPLQALGAMNDPAHFDAARGLARRVVAEGGGNTAGRAAYAFRLCTGRRPGEDETARIVEAWETERKTFASDPAAARKVLPGSEGPDGAAWTLVSNALLNLDETLTKE